MFVTLVLHRLTDLTGVVQVALAVQRGCGTRGQKGKDDRQHYCDGMAYSMDLTTDGGDSTTYIYNVSNTFFSLDYVCGAW